MEKYWQLDVKQASKQLNGDLENGLTASVAGERFVQYGSNRLQGAKSPSPWAMFFAQFNDFIVWVLIGAALVSGFLQEWIDAAVIIGIVIVNAILGFVQEYRAEKSLAAFKKLSSPNSKIIRDGERKLIASDELVPGDLIEIEAGDNIGADSRIVWATSNFSVQEASLTGESSAVVKNISPIDKNDVPLGDRVNLLYMGTSVVSGKARALVYSTGMNTELGKIAGMIQNVKSNDTPLQKKLEQFGKWIVVSCFILIALVFMLGLLRGGSLLEMFLTSVSLAVAVIPESLPAVVTIALALGVQRMVKRHALIRKLPSVETLGCATVICSDKTRTLLPLWAMEIYKFFVRKGSSSGDLKPESDNVRRKKAKRGFWRMLYIKLVRLNDTPPRIAVGFGLGVFVGNMPGIGPISALVAATVLRVNKVAAVLGALLVNTWFGLITFIPGVKLGCAIMGKDWHHIHDSWGIIVKNKDILSFFKESAFDVLLPVLLGQLIISLVIGFLAWGIVLFALYGMKERKRRIREALLKKE
jgi:uncharacterized protein (DUF2062 family)